MNRLAEAENVLLTAYEEARLYRPSAKGETLCQLASTVYVRKGDSRRVEHWNLESQRASIEFAAFKSDAQRQQAWVAGRWLA